MHNFYGEDRTQNSKIMSQNLTLLYKDYIFINGGVRSLKTEIMPEKVIDRIGIYLNLKGRKRRRIGKHMTDLKGVSCTQYNSLQ